MKIVRVFCLVLLAAAGGCAYRLGTSLPNDMRTVHVPIFVNQTEEPLLEAETTGATIREFQKDGTLRVAPLQEADCILTVVLSEYTLSPLRYDRDNLKSVQEYRLVIKANMRLENARKKEIMVEQTVTGQSTFEVSGDLSAAKTTALPKAAQDLAHYIVAGIAEYW